MVGVILVLSYFLVPVEQKVVNAADHDEDGPHFIYLPFVEPNQLSATATDEPLRTVAETRTPTPSPLPTLTPTIVRPTVDTFSGTPTALPMSTAVPTLAAVPMLTAAPVVTLTPTLTSVVSSTVTATFTPVFTQTPMPTVTTTMVPSATDVTPTSTLTPVVTPTVENNVVMPTVSATFTPTVAATVVFTETPTLASSPTEAAIDQVTPTVSTTVTPTVLVTVTPTVSITVTPTVLATVAPTLMVATVTWTPTVTGTVGTVLLPPTSTPTAVPSVVPTPTVIVVNSACSTVDLADLSTAEIVAMVQSDPDCAEPLVALLIDDPDPYFDAFYALVPSVEATEALWWAVYREMSRGNFQFSADHVENFWANLPDAAAACTDHARCPFWHSYMVEPLLRGELYRCPNVEALDVFSLLESVPYGNYYCTENSANALIPLVDEAGIGSLLTIAADEAQGWSRRNGLRVLGRIAGRGAADPAGALVLDTLADDVKAMLLARLQLDRSTYALEDLIWIGDSYFYPLFEMQPALEEIAQDVMLADTVTFRAMAAITRLLVAKDGLLEDDLDFVLEQLNSTAIYVRTQAARTLTVLLSDHVSVAGTTRGDAERVQIMGALADRIEIEDDFMTRIALQEAFDLYAGTDVVSQMRAEYEAENLAATLVDAPITIRSGLDEGALPHFLARMKGTEAAFFDTLGESFRDPVAGDPTDAMTLLLFETRAAYQQYMDAFVGYGSQAGGLYIERDATLYTYQRTAAESSFTIEHLVQHEFTHYLNGRYVFPGLWTDPGFHEQPKGWIDEGAAEYFGLTSFAVDGSYSHPLSAQRLDTICANSVHSDLDALINRRLGYDEVGVFDYDYAWSFMYYLFQERPTVALRIFDEYRAETYDVTSFAAIAGVSSITSLEVAWHARMDGWCASHNLIRAASFATGNSAQARHESHVLNHDGGIYTVPLPPVQSTGELGDKDEVIRLITSE